MDRQDCYVGQRVVYNNERGFNSDLYGEKATVISLRNDFVRIQFDNANTITNSRFSPSVLRDFGTYYDCIDFDPDDQNEAEILLSLEDTRDM